MENYSHSAILVPPGGLARNNASAQFDLGQIVHDGEGNFYRYVKATEALAIGQAVTSTALGAWDTTIVVDGAVTSGDELIHVDTPTSAITANQYAGYFVSQATATGLGKAYQIASHAAMAASTGEADINLVGAVSEAFADGAVLYIFNPHVVELVDADTEVIKGIAIGTITATYYGFVQIGGFFRAVECGHSTSAAIVVNESVGPVSGNPGAVQGVVSSNAEADVHEAAASGLISCQAVAANTTGYIQAFSKGIL
jgi:hypothetical protein